MQELSTMHDAPKKLLGDIMDLGVALKDADDRGYAELDKFTARTMIPGAALIIGIMFYILSACRNGFDALGWTAGIFFLVAMIANIVLGIYDVNAAHAEHRLRLAPLLSQYAQCYGRLLVSHWLPPCWTDFQQETPKLVVQNQRNAQPKSQKGHVTQEFLDPIVLEHWLPNSDGKYFALNRATQLMQRLFPAGFRLTTIYLYPVITSSSYSTTVCMYITLEWSRDAAAAAHE